jgi:hypothetical protein
MNSVNNNVALLVHSCDRYEFLFKGFEIFFSKYWHFSTDCNYYFATEEKKVTINNFENIQSGKGEWADRLKILLEERIKEEYILYFQEDMWLNKKTNALFFNQLFELAKKNNWQQVKLHSSEVYKTISTDQFIEEFQITKVDNANSGFIMSHQVTLWNKSFLIKQLLKNEHPWRNERKGTQSGESGKTNHLIPEEADHLIPVQIDRRILDQTDHPKKEKVHTARATIF